MSELERKTAAVLRLLPEEHYDDAETSKGQVTVEGVDDPDRMIDTTVKHCSTLLMPSYRISIEHRNDTATITVENRK